MIFARIENGIVREVQEWEKLPDFHPSLVWVEGGVDTEEGDLYDGVSFTKPPVIDPAPQSDIPTLHDRIAALENAVISGDTTEIQAIKTKIAAKNAAR